MVSDEAVVWQPIQMTLIHRFPGITVFKYCVGASNLTPLLPNVSSERTCRIRSRFLLKKRRFFDILFTSRCVVVFEANVTPGHGLWNLLRHLFTRIFPYVDFHKQTPSITLHYLGLLRNHKKKVWTPFTPSRRSWTAWHFRMSHCNRTPCDRTVGYRSYRAR
jgi:hypothetical protein